MEKKRKRKREQRRQRRRAAIVEGFQPAEGEKLHGTHPKERAVMNIRDLECTAVAFIAGYGQEVRLLAFIAVYS